MKNFLLFVASIILAIIFAPWLGQFYEFIINHQVSSTFFGSAHPEYLEGFVMGFAFFMTLLLWIFGTGMKKYVIIITAGEMIACELMVGYGMGIVIIIVATAIAFALSQLILLARKKIGK